MKKLVSLFLLFASSVVYAGNNDIYITQSGTGLTMNIDQIGDTNKVGTSQARATFAGASMTVDIDQVGDTNTMAASVAQGASTSFTANMTGDSNTTTLALGATGDVANTDFDYAATGDSNVLTMTQGAAATATAGNQDIVVAGTSNNINATPKIIMEPPINTFVSGLSPRKIIAVITPVTGSSNITGNILLTGYFPKT